MRGGRAEIAPRRSAPWCPPGPEAVAGRRGRTLARDTKMMRSSGHRRQCPGIACSVASAGPSIRGRVTRVAGRPRRMRHRLVAGRWARRGAGRSRPIGPCEASARAAAARSRPCAARPARRPRGLAQRLQRFARERRHRLPAPAALSCARRPRDRPECSNLVRLKRLSYTCAGLTVSGVKEVCRGIPSHAAPRARGWAPPGAPGGRRASRPRCGGFASRARERLADARPPAGFSHHVAVRPRRGSARRTDAARASTKGTGG